MAVFTAAKLGTSQKPIKGTKWTNSNIWIQLNTILQCKWTSYSCMQQYRQISHLLSKRNKKKRNANECLYIRLKKQTKLIVFLRDMFMYIKFYLESRKIITRITKVTLCEWLPQAVIILGRDNMIWEEQGLFEQEGKGLFLDLNGGYKDVSLQTVHKFHILFY